MKWIMISALGFLVAAGCGTVGETQNLGEITVKVPTGWRIEKPSSGFRKAQYTLPAEKGDQADAECIVFFFGSGQGGDVQSNLERWYGFFKQPGDETTKEKAKVTKKKVDGFNVTLLDVGGTYVAPKRPGSPERFHEPKYRMLSAIVEGKDSYFIRCIGPERTIAKWTKSFSEFINSIKRAQ